MLAAQLDSVRIGVLSKSLSPSQFSVRESKVYESSSMQCIIPLIPAGMDYELIQLVSNANSAVWVGYVFIDWCLVSEESLVIHSSWRGCTGKKLDLTSVSKSCHL
jgi:hypothetical protein